MEVAEQLLHYAVSETPKACSTMPTRGSGPTYLCTLSLQASHGSNVLGMQEYMVMNGLTGWLEKFSCKVC